MGRGRKGSGVEALKTCIRVRFMWNGQRRVETLNFPPTPKNIRWAEILMADVREALAKGRFRHKDFFNSDAPSDESTLSNVADNWLRVQTSAGDATEQEYRLVLNAVWRPVLGDRAVGDILPMHIEAVVKDRLRVVCAKTVQNELVPLRLAFRFAVKNKLLASNPVNDVDAPKAQSAEPDPFDLPEMELILADLKDPRRPIEAWAYYAFAFATGMRPSELIALTWDKIDWRARTASVAFAITRRKKHDTKSHRVRTVDLTALAMAALEAMKPITFMAGQGEQPIFINPVTRRPWCNDEKQRKHHFKPALRRLGLRDRDAYACRHTYATLALMGDIKIAYLAQQMGHTDLRTLLKHYARWVRGRADVGERDKLERLQLATNWPREKSED